MSVCRTYDESDVGDVAAHGHLTLRNCHIFPYDWQGERGELRREGSESEFGRHRLSARCSEAK